MPKNRYCTSTAQQPKTKHVSIFSSFGFDRQRPEVSCWQLVLYIAVAEVAQILANVQKSPAAVEWRNNTRGKSITHARENTCEERHSFLWD